MIAGRLVPALIVAFISATAARADPLDGWWISDGYGVLLEIKGDKIKASEITAVSCFKTWEATRQADTPEGAEAVFIRKAGALTILVRPGNSADHTFFEFRGAAASVAFQRIKESPAVCQKTAANTPLNNFDIFWTTFDEHYPFFGLHGVNWRDVRNRYRPKITDQTTPEELFGILKAMVEPLGDAHIALQSASRKQRFVGKRANTTRVGDLTSRRVREIVENNYRHGELKTWCNGRVGYGLLPGSIGYLRITAFAGYTSASGFEEEAKALEEALDKAFKSGDKLHGLIIDVRINQGGSDVLGVAVAARLAARDYLAFAKKARNDPSDPSRFAALQETPVRARSRPHFHGEAVLLTGSNTVSAGETFTMALMGRTPPVIRMGENTQGVFSDVLGRSLPNGFRFGLPNEIFLTADGKAFDVAGIPPHVQVPVFPQDDLEKGRDGALEKAQQILREK
jgi:C-terminal processing protease CtpA/Prc